MTKENNQKKLKQIIDNLLLINLFTVIFFAIFFIFAIIMQLNGIFIFINFIQIVWNPLVVPLITIPKKAERQGRLRLNSKAGRLAL